MHARLHEKEGITMHVVRCERCGSVDFAEEGGHRICLFCRTKYALEERTVASSGSFVSISDDIANLLKKCADDPRNARRYANRILDIDPTNQEALSILHK